MILIQFKTFCDLCTDCKSAQ